MEEYIKDFPEHEWANRKKIICLMKDWKKEISTKEKILFVDDNTEYPPDHYFYYDGFFPNYFNQDTKLLFIAREARWACGADWIRLSLDHFKSGNSIAASSFWRRIFKMVYGIRTKGAFEFKKIPSVNDYVRELDKTNNYGFAVMNMSKYSNDREDGGKADSVLMDRFLRDSNLGKRNFFKEELAILDPDVIIAANLWDGKIKEEYTDLCFNKITPIKFNAEKTAALNTMELNNKTVKLIDLYHFSSRKADKDYYYDPVIQFLFKDA